tara:strand:+ start:388 stop:834 length:447 start_codon:yes stop_codon:yes gene_type:complete
MGCNQSPTEQTPAATPKAAENAKAQCLTTGIPDVRAIYSAEGELIWDDATGAPIRGVIYDAIEIHGDNLCAGTFTMADGVHPAIELPRTVVDGKNLFVKIPWDRPRVDNSILLRTKKSFTKINLSVLPWNEVKRQIYVNEVKQKVFKK